jgi:5-methylcytosine-specific restriction endonuclease McrA
MPKNPLDLSIGKELFRGSTSFLGEGRKRRKKVCLKPAERVYVWEHPEIYGRTCSICGKKITRISDLQLDHTKPYSKGGRKMALAHSLCNRMKGSRNLREVQTRLRIKTVKSKKKMKKGKPKRRAPASIFDLPKTKSLF